MTCQKSELKASVTVTFAFNKLSTKSIQQFMFESEVCADNNLFGRVFGAPPASDANIRGESWPEILANLSLRFLLAALLGAVLAYRPRKRMLILKRNPCSGLRGSLSNQHSRPERDYGIAH